LTSYYYFILMCILVIFENKIIRCQGKRTTISTKLRPPFICIRLQNDIYFLLSFAPFKNKYHPTLQSNKWFMAGTKCVSSWGKRKAGEHILINRSSIYFCCNVGYLFFILLMVFLYFHCKNH